MIADYSNIVTMDRIVNTTYLDMTVAAPANFADAFSTVLTSSKMTIDLPIAGTVPMPRAFNGDRVINQLSRSGFSMTTKLWELTLDVNIYDLNADTFNVYATQFRQQMTNALNQKDYRLFQFLENGDTTTFGTCHDGGAFFSATHPLGTSGNTYSNFTTGAQPAWYLVDTSKSPLFYGVFQPLSLTARVSPTDPYVFDKARALWGTQEHSEAGYGNPYAAHKSKATLDEAGLTAAIAAMKSRVNDKGINLGINPNLLIVPPSLEMAGRKLVSMQYNQYGASNVLLNVLQLGVWNKLSNV